MAERKTSKRVSRSVRLKKYEAAYEACLKKAMSACKKKSDPSSSKKSKRKHKSKTTPSETVSKRKSPKKEQKRPLNAYQKFVRDESKKSKYKGMLSSDRMRAIGKAWKNLK